MSLASTAASEDSLLETRSPSHHPFSGEVLSEHISEEQVTSQIQEPMSEMRNRSEIESSPIKKTEEIHPFLFKFALIFLLLGGIFFIVSQDVAKIQNSRTPIVLTQNRSLDAYYDLLESVGYLEDDSF